MIGDGNQPGSRFPTGVVNLEPGGSLSEREISGVIDRIREHTGIDYHPGQGVTLRNALVQRMLHLDMPSIGNYLKLIRGDGGEEELARLVSLIIVQKTSFFRDRPQFELLERRVLPEFLAGSQAGPRGKGGDARVSIWSAGCSTGEEPYSIAMALKRSPVAVSRASILATDISREVLARAAEARYPEKNLDELNDKERALFMPDKGRWRLTEGVRSLVEFKLHNLVSYPYPLPSEGQWDVIFCRNVLIYFNRETVREIIENFRRVLNPGGYLFLGVSESLFQLSEGFELISTGKAFVYRNPVEKRKGVVQPKKRVERRQPPQPVGDRLRRRMPAASSGETGSELESDIQRARKMVAAGDREAAFRVLFDLTARQPDAIQPYMMLGEIALDRGAMEEAWSWYQVVTELRPTDIESRFLLAIVLYRLGHDQEAAEHLRRLLFLDGSLALGHYYLGVVAHRLGDIDTALRSFRNALSSIETGVSEKGTELLVKHNLSLDELAEASQARLRQLE
jgi:chemotaxis protein methyltransferase CheR